MKPTHRRSTAYIGRLWLGALLALSAGFAWIHAQAQQQSDLEGVAIFAPQIVAEQKPQVGLYGITELMTAARHADIESARLLIEAGADVNEADNSNDTALLWAVNSGAVEMVNFLIRQGADVDAKSNRGATPLIMAISRNREAIAVALINAGADPKGRVNPARNFLEAAAEGGMTGVVEALIANGVDLSTHGASALSYAILKRNKDAAILLLNAGVDVNATATLSKNTILHAAAASGDIDMVRLLISRGADASQPPSFGSKAPLYPAVRGGHTAIAKLLLDNGSLATPYYIRLALRLGTADTAAALLDRLDLANLERADMETFLETADYSGHEDVVRRLLDTSSAPRVNNESVKLILRRAEDADCNLLAWNPRTNKQRQIYEEEGDCSASFFVADGPSTLFALQNNEIRVISIDPPFEDKVVDYPVDVINGQMQKLSDNFKKWYEYARDRDASDAKPAAIGYLENGELGLATYTSGPGDGIYANLFGLISGEWTFVAKRSCDRTASDCSFSQLNGRAFSSWPRQRTAWNPSIRKNPYFQAKENGASRFKFGGTESLLKFSTDTNECDGYCMDTRRLELVLPTGQTMVLSDNGRNSISENLVLLEHIVRSSDLRSWQRSINLFDMKTGEKVLEPMQLATWID